MAKIIMVSLAFVWLAFVGCKKTCIEVELLDVLYISDKYILPELFEFNDSEYKVYLNDYFVNTNKLIFKLSIPNQSIQSDLIYNKYGEIFNCNAYKIYSINEQDTVCIGNRFELIDRSIMESLFCCNLFDTIDFNDSKYFVLRIEDISKIENGFLYISAFANDSSLNCSQEATKDICKFTSGICFAIKDGKFEL